MNATKFLSLIVAMLLIFTAFAGCDSGDGGDTADTKRHAISVKDEDDLTEDADTTQEDVTTGTDTMSADNTTTNDNDTTADDTTTDDTTNDDTTNDDTTNDDTADSTTNDTTVNDTTTDDTTTEDTSEQVTTEEETYDFVFSKNSGSDGYTVIAVSDTFKGGVADIPATHKGVPVTAIGETAFKSESITKVIIPENVEFIGANAFSMCTRLTSVSLPSSLKAIYDGAFSHCGTLQKINIPKNVESIGTGVFSGCSNMVIMTVDSANTYYKGEGNCIIDLSNATLIAGCQTSVIPNGVRTIAKDAFKSIFTLVSINIPKSVTYIKSGALASCSCLKNINYGGSEADWANIVKEDGWYSRPAGSTNVYTINYNA